MTLPNLNEDAAMNEPQPLASLLTHAESQRDAARADQRQALAAHQAALTQSQQLLCYRLEYEQRWNSQFARHGQIELVRCYQGFMDRLTEAVEQQERVARHAGVQLERAQATLLAQELRVVSVQKLIGRRIAQAQLQTDRRDAKQSDEITARLAWGRMNGNGRNYAA